MFEVTAKRFKQNINELFSMLHMDVACSFVSHVNLFVQLFFVIQVWYVYGVLNKRVCQNEICYTYIVYNTLLVYITVLGYKVTKRIPLENSMLLLFNHINQIHIWTIISFDNLSKRQLVLKYTLAKLYV